MSDADDQMGGQGGETGPNPADQSGREPDPVKGNVGGDARPGEDRERNDNSEKVDRAGADSLPASDPPGNG
jgi:hypothetical protein